MPVNRSTALFSKLSSKPSKPSMAWIFYPPGHLLLKMQAPVHDGLYGIFMLELAVINMCFVQIAVGMLGNQPQYLVKAAMPHPRPDPCNKSVPV